MCNSKTIAFSKGNQPKSGFDTHLRPDRTASLSAQSKAEVTSTPHSANCVVVNQWNGQAITNVTLRHQPSNTPANPPQIRTWSTLDSDVASSPPLPVSYSTGAFSPFDYWWVEFTDSNNQTWSCKPNFYCSLETEDDGRTIFFFLNGAAQELQIQMVSAGCTVSLSSN